MKSIDEAIKRLNDQQITSLKKKSGLSISASKSVKNLTILDLQSILTKLNASELIFLKALYLGSDGLTFSELEKKTGQNINEIEANCNRLVSLLLCYHIKNRQLLTNKMDKVYMIKEIKEIIAPTEDEIFQNQLTKLASLLSRPVKITQAVLTKKSKEYKFIEQVALKGGIITIEDAEKILEKHTVATLKTLEEKRYIQVLHSISEELITGIIISPSVYAEIIHSLDEKKENEDSANNFYNLILNLLITYDNISSFGLFLTKQDAIRKIDKKRITDSLLPLKDYKGEVLDEELSADLSLTILNRLKALHFHKDMAHISIKKLKHDFENPHELSGRLLKIITKKEDTEHFPNPIGIPDHQSSKLLLQLMLELQSTSIEHLRAVFMLKTGIEQKNFTINSYIENEKNYLDSFSTTLNMGVLMGLYKASSEKVHITDIGIDTALNLLKTDATPSEKEDEGKHNIYINPDFTLLIPPDEIPSRALYNLLSHTDIVSQDVVIHARITQQAIIRAHKRGLNLKIFTNTLRAYAKNEIPQNLEFLLKEWASQTISVAMNYVILMKVNNTAFLDELLYNTVLKDNIERIAPNYAIVNKSQIDDIVRLAREQDAAISLFEAEE